jgi:hypothetical protein
MKNLLAVPVLGAVAGQRRLVAITHDWALRSGHPSVDAWWETIAPLLAEHGFTGARRGREPTVARRSV